MAGQMRIQKLLHRSLNVLGGLVGPVTVLILAVAVFWDTFKKYRYSPQYYYLNAMVGEGVSWSRGSASVLCISFSLVLLPMCRNTLTLVRSSIELCITCKRICRGFRRSLDRSVWFHKACAVVIIIASGIHIGAHIVNVKRFSTNFSFNFRDLNFASYPNQEPIEIIATSVAGVTGVLMTLILLAMIADDVIINLVPRPSPNRKIVTSTYAIRRASFEIFWYTHHAFVVLFLLLFVHGLGGVIKHQVNVDRHPPGCKMTQNSTVDGVSGRMERCAEEAVFEADRPQAWMWCIGPLIIYITERLIRAYRSYQNVELIKVLEHTDGVMELTMKKNKFAAEPGQYVFINCSDVSRFEWHPFTLTQCPSTERPTFTIHFKTLGDWTEKFADVLLSWSRELTKTQFVSGLRNGEYRSHVVPRIRLAVDGPYGSPSTDVWRYDVSFCIATGIGVTPFAAVVNQLRNQITRRRRCFKLHRLYFVWVCKHMQSFHWFVDLLHSFHKELWESNQPDFLICNFYATGVCLEDKLVMKQPSGWLASRLHDTKPTWKSLFERVSIENPRTNVGVFYCGSGKITRILKRNCERFYPTRTKFVLNEEALS